MTVYYSVISKFLTPLLLVSLAVCGYWAYTNNQANIKKINTLQQKIEKQKESENQATNTVEKLSKQVETLYKEKNDFANEALETTTKELFSTVYNYRTDRKEDSVKERKNKASKIADENALEGLFPRDSDKAVPSVSTVSWMSKEPEIYLMPTDKKQLTALVVVHYALSIAGSEEQTGTFMYKVKFDPLANQFTAIQNIGSVNLF